VKPINSLQVESEKTKGILQQVESDATSSSLNRTISLEIIPAVTYGSNHVADQDVDNDEDQGHPISDVQESIAVRRAHRNPRKPSWITTNMIVASALSIVEEVIPSTYREAEISSESKM